MHGDLQPRSECCYAGSYFIASLVAINVTSPCGFKPSSMVLASDPQAGIYCALCTRVNSDVMKR